jgi:hypothetical protein
LLVWNVASSGSVSRFEHSSLIRAFSLSLFSFLCVFQIPALLVVVILLCQSGEMASWYYTQTGITFPSVNAITLPYSFQELKPYVFAGILTLILFMACAHFPAGIPCSVPIPSFFLPLILI